MKDNIKMIVKNNGSALASLSFVQSSLIPGNSKASA